MDTASVPRARRLQRTLISAAAVAAFAAGWLIPFGWWLP